MLDLTLRKEFQGRRLKGTAIELTDSRGKGATQIAAEEFLQITYPSTDALTAIEAVGPDRGQPLVLIGERGQGKSHLMAMLHHAFTNSDATRMWLKTWADRFGRSNIAELPLRDGMYVISESLHRQNYKFLWDILFENHPHGREVRGMWQGLGDKKTDIPSYKYLLELFRHTPTALILDEFQTWFDGLTNTKQYPWRTWAFNFVQLLSEISKEHPELLVLIVSVRNGGTDAFQQIQRVAPKLVDFKGPTAKQDRQKLLLHRLFENRIQVPESDIQLTVDTHLSEYLRLGKVSPAEHEQNQQEFVECWPFAPHLMRLLEDQVLIATHAQETRDLIRILADLFKGHGDNPIITAADFQLNNEKSGIAALLDSVSNEHHADLREIAQRNLSAVTDAVEHSESVVPHLSKIIGALWLRSLSVGNMAGAEPDVLQIDITRDKPIDDNEFHAELSAIVENSFNIHQDGERLVFRQEENPQAKLLANARNDRQFSDGSDLEQLAREVRYVIGGQEEVSTAFRVVVFRSNWTSTPWDSIEERDQPQHWDERIPLLILPISPESMGSTLGPWLRDHLQKQRNAVRFLLPRMGSNDIFYERDLLILARAVVLAQRWGVQEPAYRKLKTKYEQELRSILAKRFDRLAILASWNYQEPEKCTFHVEAHRAEGAKIPEAIDRHIQDNLFIPEDFETLILAAAEKNESIGKLLGELQEPRPSGETCIPWLGEIKIKERIIRMCARGSVAINLRGMEQLQIRTGEEEEATWRRIRGRLGTGRHLNETYLLLPQAVPHSEGMPESTLLQIDNGDQEGSQENIRGGDAINRPPSGSANENIGNKDIFDTAAKLRQCAAEATSALNLLGQVEAWGVGPGTQIQNMSLKIGSLTGAQLDELLRALPDGIIYELDLIKEER